METITNRDALWSLIFDKLQDAKTEEDLEAINDLADDAVTAGILTQEEVDELWDLAPCVEY